MLKHFLTITRLFVSLFFVTIAVQSAFAAPGDLDLTFNSTGFRITDVTSTADDEANAVAIQADGKIIAAGSSFNDSEFALVRYTTSGALDTTFGTGGIVRTAFSIAGIRTIAIQSDGKIVVGGNIGTTRLDFAVARYTSSGALDTSFGGGDGVVTTQIGTSSSYVNSIAIQSDGKILAAGHARITVGQDDFVLTRYTASGSLDTAFGIKTKNFFGNLSQDVRRRRQYRGRGL